VGEGIRGAAGRASGPVDARGVPVRHPDHAVRRAAAAAAHGGRGRRRAPVHVQGELRGWLVLDLRIRPAAPDGGRVQQLFEEALTALWQGEAEDDGFNALVLMAGLTWREVTLLRAYAKYLRQGGMRFSEDYVQRVLRSHAPITRLL